MTEDEYPITADELHRHIKATIFGRPWEKFERFDQLQKRLHEIVDLFFDVKPENRYEEKPS